MTLPIMDLRSTDKSSGAHMEVVHPIQLTTITFGYVISSLTQFGRHPSLTEHNNYIHLRIIRTITKERTNRASRTIKMYLIYLQWYQ